MQMQSLSVPLAQHSIEVTQSSTHPERITNYDAVDMDSTLPPSDHTTQQSYNSSFESQSIDITSINTNIHDSRAYNLQPTSKANISTIITKQNNLMDVDTDKVNISTTNVTLNNQMDVDSIATRMKSNKRRRNKT